MEREKGRGRERSRRGEEGRRRGGEGAEKGRRRGGGGAEERLEKKEKRMMLFVSTFNIFGRLLELLAYCSMSLHAAPLVRSAV